MENDVALLRRFAEEGSQEAFAELVRAKVDLVFAAALRQTGGDAHLAQDVTQAVFIALAARAPALVRHTMLTGWLFTTTRHVAIDAVRRQRRWQRREEEAQIMKTTGDGPEAAWSELRPVIDEALHELGEKDRAALLLRFFEGHSLAEVGERIGLAENSARMRVDRALEKLRGRLARRGITSTAAALGGVLAAQPAIAAPVGLAASVSGAALAGAALGGTAIVGGPAALLAFMGTTKIVVGAAALLAVGALGGYLGAQQQQSNSGGASSRESVVLATTSVAQVGARLQATASVTGSNAPSDATPAAVGAVAKAGSASGLDPLRALLDLQRRNLVASDVSLVSGGAQLTSQFKELFVLTPAEQSALQRGLDAARERVSELAQENSSLTRSPQGDVVFATKAFPEAGGAAYDALMKTFAETLGSERYNAFVTLGAEQAEKELDHFGTAQRQVAIARLVSDDGEIRYRIRSNESRTPEDNSNYLSDRMTYDELVKQVGPLAKLLPADFGPRR